MMKVFAEKRPSQRARLGHFRFVFCAGNYHDLNAMLAVVVSEEPVRASDIGARRFHVKGRHVFVRDEDDAITLMLHTNTRPQVNPNHPSKACVIASALGIGPNSIVPPERNAHADSKLGESHHVA